MGKYTGKEATRLLVNMVFKAARLLQPSVIMVDQCEKMFGKKIPKTDKVWAALVLYLFPFYDRKRNYSFNLLHPILQSPTFFKVHSFTLFIECHNLLSQTLIILNFNFAKWDLKCPIVVPYRKPIYLNKDYYIPWVILKSLVTLNNTPWLLVLFYKTDPKRLRRELPRAVKTIKQGDRILLVGCTHAPFDAKVKPFCKLYDRIILLPRPDYASRYRELFSNGELSTAYITQTTHMLSFQSFGKWWLWRMAVFWQTPWTSPP